MRVNIQGAEHDINLQRIEQIRVINTATRKQVHERAATSQTLFFQQGGMA